MTRPRPLLLRKWREDRQFNAGASAAAAHVGRLPSNPHELEPAEHLGPLGLPEPNEDTWAAGFAWGAYERLARERDEAERRADALAERLGADAVTWARLNRAVGGGAEFTRKAVAEAVEIRIAAAERKAAAWDETNGSGFADRAHAAARGVPGGLGRNVWHVCVEVAERAALDVRGMNELRRVLAMPGARGLDVATVVAARLDRKALESLRLLGDLVNALRPRMGAGPEDDARLAARAEPRERAAWSAADEFLTPPAGGGA